MPWNRPRTNTFFRLPALALLLGLLPQTVMAQILSTGDGNLFANGPAFDAGFLATNKIKSIKGTVSTKADLKPIRDVGLVQEYAFNRKGEWIMQLTTAEVSGKPTDTTLVFRSFGQATVPQYLRTINGAGVSTYRYEYDSLNRVVGQAYYREENIGDGQLRFRPGRQFLITEEAFRYPQGGDLTSRKQYLNGQGKVYKELTVTVDTLGNFVEKTTRFNITQRRQTFTYSYNAENRVQEITEFSNVVGRYSVTYQYEYDEVGNVISEKTYRNGDLKQTKEFLYDERLLLSALLWRDEGSQSIRIVRFAYEFY